MVHPATLPGFLAAGGEAAGEKVRWPEPVTHHMAGPVDLWFWGLEAAPGPDLTLTVSRVARDTGGAVPATHVATMMRSHPAALTRLLPPFAAVSAGAGGVTMVADSLGFQHLFHAAPDSRAVPLLSSSCLLAARAAGAELDRTAVAVQSLLGWQLGQRTLFTGIQKLGPGAVAHLGTSGLQVTAAEPFDAPPLPLERAVAEAAALLRTSLAAILDDHPDAVLQLTGGMDSRLLLSAVPEKRRKGMRAMTLAVPGNGDVAIARAIAQRYQMSHEVHGLGAVQDLDPSEAWDRCVADAIRLDAMSDPVALAAQRVAEQAFDQGVRISGLGGEVARGFYYLGRVQDRGYSRHDVERLASWRMFVNEAVEPGLLTPEFSAWAREVANQEVFEAMTSGGDEWFRAADELYVRHRMQRWAGATDTAVADQRVVLNPMLDPGFLAIAARLTPGDKARARFLAALQMELDPELGHRPLDGRPAPAAYADPPWWQPVHDVIALGRRAAGKGLQRLRRGNRPPAGGAVMAAKVVESWRAQPAVLAPLDTFDFLRHDWVDDVLARRVEPRPSSVALLTNLIAAKSPVAATSSLETRPAG